MFRVACSIMVAVQVLAASSVVPSADAYDVASDARMDDSPHRKSASNHTECQ